MLIQVTDLSGKTRCGGVISDFRICICLPVGRQRNRTSRHRKL